MHRFLSVLLLGTTLAHAQVFGPREAEPDPDLLLSFIPDTVARYADGKTIEGAAVRALMLPQLKQMLKAGHPPDGSHLVTWAATLTNSLLDHRLMYEQARAAGFQADPDIGRKHLAAMRKQMGDAGYRQMLATNGLNATELGLRLAEGFAVDQWVMQTALPDDAQLERAARQHYQANPERYGAPKMITASHILIKLPDEPNDRDRRKARKRAEKLLRRIREGEDFAEVARSESDCPSRERGGDLGTFTPGTMVAAFEQLAVALEQDQISELVETEYGFHIIKGGQQLDAGMRPYEEVRAQVLEEIRETRKRDVFRALRDKVRREANAIVFLAAP